MIKLIRGLTTFTVVVVIRAIIGILLLAFSLVAASILAAGALWPIYGIVRWFPSRRSVPNLPPAATQIRGVTKRQLLGDDNRERKVDGIFEGGGVKAIAQIGAVQAAEQLGLRWSLLGGTSGGAIVAALLALGRSSKEIWQILVENDLSQMVDAKYLPSLSWCQKRYYFYLPLLPHFLLKHGLVAGSEFLQVMRQELRWDNRDLTFGDLRNDEYPADPGAPQHRLKIVATDISRGVPIVLPDDLDAYWEPRQHAADNLGKSPAEVTCEEARDCWPVAETLRMSMSIPFFFAPYKLHIRTSNGKQGREVLIVDGGVSSNFPIWLFDRFDRPPRWPTFGFLLDESKQTGRTSIREPPLVQGLLPMTRAIIRTGMGARDKRLSEHDKYRTARLQTLGIGGSNFGLTREQQQNLYCGGREDAVDFFRHFKWAEYIARFRQPSDIANARRKG